MIPLPDWIWLFIQITLLATVGLREFLRPHGRNIYVMALSAATLFLVHGQAWWLFSEFESRGTTVIGHINKTISIDGARLANLYIGLSVLCFCVTYFFLSKRKSLATALQPISDKVDAYSGITNFLLICWTFLFASVAVTIMGGVEILVSQPGQFMGRGATVFLVLVHLGRLQLLKKTAARQKFSAIEILLFGFVIIFQTFNGRGWMLFFLLQLFIATNYCRRELPRRLILGGVAVFLFVAIVFGMYRHFTSISDVIGSSELQEYIIKYSDSDNPINWFYSTSVEGFCGLAGILTYEDDVHGIFHDFGISNLNFWLKLIPFAIRLDTSLPFVALDEFITGAYPYPDSITRSGYESFYAHFGVIGLLAFGVLLAYLANKFHLLMMNPSKNRFLISIFSAYLLLPLYGNLYFIFFYSMTESIGLFFFSAIRMASKSIWLTGLMNKRAASSEHPGQKVKQHGP